MQYCVMDEYLYSAFFSKILENTFVFFFGSSKAPNSLIIDALAQNAVYQSFTKFGRLMGFAGSLMILNLQELLSIYIQSRS